jgi:hypothetical protein
MLQIATKYVDGVISVSEEELNKEAPNGATKI